MFERVRLNALSVEEKEEKNGQQVVERGSKLI